MGNTNTPYIGKAANPLANPTSTTVFTQLTSPIATVASTQVAKPVYVRYAGYSQYGSGVSDNINVVNIKVRIAGRVTGGTTTNFTPSIQIAPVGTILPSTTTTFANLASLTATAFNSASGNFTLKADLVWDPVSGQINGIYNGYAGSGGAQTTAALTAITPQTGYIQAAPASTQPTTVAQYAAAVNNGGELQLFFVAAGLFSASNANNIAYLDMFEVEVE